MPISFFSVIKQAPGMKATGVPVPDEIVSALGGSKKPAVKVTVEGFSYRTTVASMFGGYIFPLSAERRVAAGLVADQPVEVEIELDLEPHTAEMPEDLALALEAAGLRVAFDTLASSRQRAHVSQIDGAKTAGTRERRISAVVAALRPGD